MNIDEASGCFILRQRIDIVNAARAKAFSRLTVLGFCAPDRLSGRDVIILNSDDLAHYTDVPEESYGFAMSSKMVANSELFALVQEYNYALRIARTCGMDELRITHLG
ncbi:hypothetical protein QM042_10135 [Escherichia coli]